MKTWRQYRKRYQGKLLPLVLAISMLVTITPTSVFASTSEHQHDNERAVAFATQGTNVYAYYEVGVSNAINSDKNYTVGKTVNIFTGQLGAIGDESGDCTTSTTKSQVGRIQRCNANPGEVFYQIVIYINGPTIVDGALRVSSTSGIGGIDETRMSFTKKGTYQSEDALEKMKNNYQQMQLSHGFKGTTIKTIDGIQYTEDIPIKSDLSLVKNSTGMFVVPTSHERKLEYKVGVNGTWQKLTTASNQPVYQSGSTIKIGSSFKDSYLASSRSESLYIKTSIALFGDATKSLSSETTFKIEQTSVKHSLDFNGGKYAGDSAGTIDIYYGEQPKLPVPSRNGYVFKGYYSSDGTKQFTNENGEAFSPYNYSTPQSFVAKWEAISTPSFVTTTLPNGIIGNAYEQQFTVSIGNGSNKSFALVAGSLPDGLSLNQTTGIIYGIPTTFESSKFKIELNNGSLSKATKEFSITIDKKTESRVPSSPTVQSKTETSVTLNPIVGLQYGYSIDGTAPASWTNDTEFKGLTPGKTYYFFQRYAETVDTKEGNPSPSVTVKTKVPVSISESQQAKEYTGEAQPFVISGTPMDKFNIEYRLEHTSLWHTEIPKNIGIYDVRINRPTDDIYSVYTKELNAAMVIAYAPFSTEQISMPLIGITKWAKEDIAINAKTNYLVSMYDGDYTSQIMLDDETKTSSDIYIKNITTGVISKTTLGYKLDKTAPSSLNISYETDEWKEFLNNVTFDLFFKDSVNVKLSAVDTGSTIKEFSYTINGQERTVEANNGSATFSIEPQFKGNITNIKAIDYAGNRSESKATQYFAIDKENPETPNTNTNGYVTGSWSKNDVTFHVSGASADSGIAKYQYSTDEGMNWYDMIAKESSAATETEPSNVTKAELTVSSKTGGTNYQFRAVSNAGNEGTISDVTVVKIDKETPTITVNGNTTTSLSNDTATISVTTGISGVEKVEVQKDLGEYKDITSSYTNGYTINENGSYTFRITNGAGDTATQNIVYDKLHTHVANADDGDCTTPITCSICEEVLVAGLNHDWNTVWIGDEDGHWRECKHTNCTKKDTKSNHKWDEGLITTPATHKVEGIKTYTCTECNQTKTESLAVLPHTWSDTWSKDETNHWHECTEDDAISDVSVHTWDEGKITTPSTHKEEGVKTYTCTECEQTKTELVAVLPHTWDEGKITTPATHKEEGIKTYTCTGCDETKTESLSVLPHTWSDTWSKDETNHWHECTEDDAISDVSVHTWDEGKVTTPSTHKKEGVKTYTCTECEQTKTELVAVLPHTWDEGKITTPATHKVEGIKTYTCTGCDETKTESIAVLPHTWSDTWSKDETNHWHECTEDDAISDVSVHTWDEGKVTTPSTHKEEGVKTYTCTECEQTKTELVAVLPHTWDEGKITTPATHKAEGIKTYTCTGCDETKTESIEVLPHTWSDTWSKDETNHWHECTEDDAISDVSAHTWDDGKITTPSTHKEEGVKTYTCTECEQTKTELVAVLPHTWDEGKITTPATHKEEGIKTYTCTECEQTKTELVAVLPHTWDEGKITTPATHKVEGIKTYTCTGCDETKTESIAVLPHTWSDTWSKDETNHWHECTEDDAVNDVSAHTWDEGKITTPSTHKEEGVKTYTCTECEQTKTELVAVLPHTWDEGKITTPATHKEEGIKTYTCTGCDETKTENIKVLPHIWDEGKITTPATHKVEGIKTYTCTGCDETKTESIAVLPHTWSDTWSKDETNHWHECTEDDAISDVSVHTWDEGKITTASTHKEEGVKTYTCTECEQTKTELVAVLPHTWDEGKITTPATHKEEGIKTYTCTGCNQTKTESLAVLPHTWSDTWSKDETNHWHECTEDDAISDVSAHTWDEGKVTTASTHKDEGVKTYTCTECEQTKTELVAVLPHTWDEGKITTPATHKVEGIKTYTCTGCDETKTESIAVLPHTWSDTWSKDETNHWHECTEDDAVNDVSAHTWDEGKVTTPSTHKDEGIKTYTCTECGQTRTEAIAVLRHAWDEGKVTVASTHTTKGVKTFTCTECDETRIESIEVLPHTWSDAWSKDETNHWHECTEDDAMNNVSEHTFNEWVLVNVATCVDKGKEFKTCTVCGYSISRDIEALGHEYSDVFTIDKEASCTGDGFKSKHCIRCESKSEIVVIPELEHIEGIWIVDQTPTRDKEGIQHKECEICHKVIKTEKIDKLAYLTEMEDNKNGVILESVGETKFDQKTKLIVEKDVITVREKNAVIAVSSNSELISLFDITLLLNGVKVQPNGDIKITLTISEEQLKNYKDFKIVYIDDDGKATILDSNVNENKISFVIDHLSNYAIIATAIEPEKPNTPNLTPDTSDGNSVNGLLILLLLSSVVLFVGSQKKKRIK